MRMAWYCVSFMMRRREEFLSEEVTISVAERRSFRAGLEAEVVTGAEL